MILYLLV